MPVAVETPVVAGSQPEQQQPLSSKARGKARFLSVFPEIVDELLGYLDRNGMPQDAKDWFKRSLEYNAPGGKLNRGISVVDTAEILKGRPLTDAEYRQAAILGWCVELLQAYFLVADDMMDQSITRRGQQCWYRVPGVSYNAINDSFMLEGSIYHLLRKYFRTEPFYADLLDLFLETTFQTQIGQLVDLITAPEDVINLDKFSLEKHRLIVVYKTAYYSFYLPVALAMHFVGITSPEAYKTAQSILIPLGEYFQVQDDYLDCFGAPEQIGKIGTDILDNKCSWNINIALRKANAEQRKILDENYGRKNAECEARVKQMYNELDVAGMYTAYEQEAYERINALIDAIPEPTAAAPSPTLAVPTNGRARSGSVSRPTNGHSTQPALKREVFRSFLDKIYKRTK